MRISIVVVLALSMFVGLCTAQCMMHQSQPSIHGHSHHCNLHGVVLSEGESYVNTTTCMKCHCGADHNVYCCAMLFHYMVPDGCVVNVKDCIQEIVYESDGSPCQALAAISRK
uniref:Uncharacterized protein LOC111115880 n=1 Tax=Crassostrea virginica TaxID=6565 RepID=A0A8B8C6J3_CRAVI|nr:uncharacterized protein LOC111115880 [Crassostrea virginica]